MTKTNYGKFLAWLIAAWFTLSFAASAFHVFQTDPDSPPLPLLMGVLAPIAVFSVWYLNSRPFRDFILSLDPRILPVVHSWRIGGLVFLVPSPDGILPPVFPRPA